MCLKNVSYLEATPALLGAVGGLQHWSETGPPGSWLRRDCGNNGVRKLVSLTAEGGPALSSRVFLESLGIDVCWLSPPGSWADVVIRALT